MALNIIPDRTVMDGFVLVHRTLLDGGHRLAEVLHRPSDGRDVAALARVWDFYRSGLEEHHAGERDVVFPLVAERDPQFVELELSMAQEHADIDALLHVADRAVAIAVSDRTLTSRRSAAEAVDALVGCLAEHLEREERLAIPRVVAAIRPDEMHAIERGFLRKISARRIAMTVAALDRTAQADRIPMPPLPLPARLALPMWRRRYRRFLAAAGLDDVGGAS
jgi:hemerythrin-like domain-containing protein